MITNQKILEKAKTEIKNLKEKQDKWYREFCLMKLYAQSLEEAIIELKNPENKQEESSNKMENMMTNSKAAMKRFTEKLRKEGI